ncbi:MAG: pentapeptide repeat-containing protein [Campylobacteraceae bacterium]|nr:pentapeptide repeat-containing protein [Campylobacteraceae bacterium]
MDFLINSWYNLEQEEKDYFQNKSKKELQDRWKTEEGIEIRRRIIEICFARGKSKNYAPYVGYCTSSEFKDELLLDLRGLDLSDYSNLFDDIIVTLDFSFCNLEFSNFSNSELSKCNFRHSNLASSDFSNTLLDESDFSSSNLSYCNFENTQLEESNFNNVNINQINLKDANINDLVFNKKIVFEEINVKTINDLNNYSFIKFINKKNNLIKNKSYLSKILNFVYKYT